tara:strand:- start:462 stop:1499 length:1038 start_codon:yes stop_codon:yes gene_type:complete
MLNIENISKFFSHIKAVDNVSLNIKNGEFFALLGPSGCGKTTLLRIISGFEKPDQGSIFINGKNVTNVEPYNRPTNMLFQSYALFPHYSVFKNISYGLEREGLENNEINKRVDEIILRTNLSGLEHRKPDQLSGGQKQRVALARCLIKKPDVLLLDEPLSALDKNLKELMKLELKKLQTEFGITFIMVTHDQDEALVMADRIAIMDEGSIVQLDTPKDIYENPKNFFAANFIGRMNFIDIKDDGENFVFQNNFSIKKPKSIKSVKNSKIIGIRPEDISIKKTHEDSIEFDAYVSYIAYHGKELELIVKSDLSNKEILIQADKSEKNINKNDKISCFISTNSIKLF